MSRVLVKSAWGSDDPTKAAFPFLHANALAECYHINSCVVNVPPIHQRLSLRTRAGNQVVHAIERAQKGRFAAPGRANQCRNLVFVNG